MLTAQKRIASSVSALLLSVMFLSSSGCLVTANSSETHTGNYIPETTFGQIEVGKTTIAWVQATLGEPTTKATADDHIIWTYSYSQRKDSSGAVFLIFGGSSSSDTPHKAYVEFKDGIVVNKWRG